MSQTAAINFLRTVFSPSRRLVIHVRSNALVRPGSLRFPLRTSFPSIRTCVDLAAASYAKAIEGDTFHTDAFSDDAGGGRNVNSRKKYVAVTNHVKKLSRQTFLVDSGKQNGHMTTSAAKINGTPAISNGSHSSKLAPTVPSYSEAVSYQNTKYTCSVGTIKCEVVKREMNGSTPGSKKFSADQAGAGISPVIAEAAPGISPVIAEAASGISPVTAEAASGISPVTAEAASGIGPVIAEAASGISPVIAEAASGISPIIAEAASGIGPVIAEAASGISPVIAEAASDVVVENQITESSFTTQSSSHVVIPTPENQPAKEAVSELSTGPIIDTHPTSEEDTELKLSSPKLDVMLEKLTVSSRQPVIFPDHLQVPELYKNQFVFGSLDATSEDSGPISVIDDSGSISVIDDSHQNGDVVTEPSLSDQNVPTAAQEVEHEDQALPDLSDHVLPAQESISSDFALKHEQTEQEMVSPIAGFQNLVFPTTRDYSYGFIPHPMSPHFVQLDVPEVQSVSSQVCTLVPTSAVQPAMAGQTSMAMSPPQFPYYRQPYPAYISYDPYFHPMYFVPNAQLLNHDVFPQQPPPVNVHMQPWVKVPAPPSQSEQESNEDLIASQANDTNVQSAVQQGEGPQVKAHAAGREVVPSLPPHYFYNFPQAQHMAFSLFQAGLCHSYQTMTSQSTVQPHLCTKFNPLVGPTQFLSTG